MKKSWVLLFLCSLLYGRLIAQVDTLSNIDVLDTLELYRVNSSGQWGYVSGQNSYYDNAKAEFFNYSGPPTTVSSVILHFGHAVSSNPNTTFQIKVWDKDANGKPGVVLDSQMVNLQDIVNDVANGDSTVVLLNGANVSGPFFVGFDLPYNSGDTFAIYTNRDGNSPPPGTAYEQWSDGSWWAFSEPTGWNYNVSTAVYPVLSTTPYKITGVVYNDLNSNCIQDASESGLKNIKLNVWNTGNYQAHIYTFLNGTYTIFLPDSGLYYVEPELGNSSIQVSCPGGGNIDTISVTGISTQNYGLNCNSGFDVSAQSVTHGLWAAPGQIHQLNVLAGELSGVYGLTCGSGISGQVEVSVSGPVTYIGPVVNALSPSVSASGTNFTYAIANFAQINMSQDFGLMFWVDTTALPGDMICVDVSVTPNAGDINPSNNTLNYCYFVQMSFDPNIKEVYPEKVLPDYSGYLTYTIHFQNTGNGPAFNIRLRDTLDSQLAPETFDVLSYSHPNQVTLTGNYLTVFYPDIMLTDSFTDPLASMGYIQYRIKPKNAMTNGTQISNTASIYFDYNAPIQTNTSLTVCQLTNNISSPVKLPHFQLLPNPVQDFFQILMDGGYRNVQMEVTDIQGNTILKETFDYVNPKNIPFRAGTGIYIIKIQADDNPPAYGKFIKE
ncbi:MAG: T9SS type A sorting domain-containing protein [Bacteroidia bacterium]|nr:T9SS type A sorting domain-containing protein [Bacteroidia bacterium]